MGLSMILICLCGFRRRDHDRISKECLSLNYDNRESRITTAESWSSYRQEQSSEGQSIMHSLRRKVTHLTRWR